MGKLVIVLVLIVLASFVWYFAKSKVSRVHGQVRDRAIEGNIGRALTAGPATKHLAMMGRTLTLGADPQRAGELVTHVATADARVTDVRADAGTVVITIDGSYPRARAHLLADRTVIGIEAMTWEMGFPQGAAVWDRIATAITTAAGHQGIPVGEGARHFVRDPAAGNDPEVWTVQVA
ncbi:hypothetical protein [Rudaeicoccus suwonensis]|uniref:Uncharacterized protein n=1 Tax=Rudaeicoccus suwonensis TaxID=657409 RepID=A0A561ECE4_9MICO|nr:hypothetical protein [Rudaeicoccus suwonensis]TWE13281.1 hypothetical protein BKA23_2110 [Rudaeicoccus suwonensis]